MTNSWWAPPIDWQVPAGPTDWLLGGGATTGERRVVRACTAAASLVVVVSAVRSGVDWDRWQWLLVAVVAVDVLGGVPANALATAKRLYHSPPRAGSHPLAQVVRRPVAFTALHLHPLVMAAALPGAHWHWALAWYVSCLVGTVAVVTTSPYLQRPVAFAVVTLALVLAPAVAAPAGLEWFGPLLIIKLVLAHAVREEPYRPGPLTRTTQETTGSSARSG